MMITIYFYKLVYFYNVKYPFTGQYHYMGQIYFQCILDKKNETVPWMGVLNWIKIRSFFFIFLVIQEFIKYFILNLNKYLKKKQQQQL
jgi:hypothetical protein